ncbi:MAG: ATPase, T2SS/T4P/T4SS family [Fibrobacterota bacterium]
MAKIGKIVLDEGLITQKQLAESLKEHKDTKKPLGVILVDRQAITAEQLVSVLDKQFEIIHKKKLGKILLEKGIIGKKQLAEALRAQAVSGKPLGEILVSLNFLKRETLLDFLASRFDTGKADFNKLDPAVASGNFTSSKLLEISALPLYRENDIVYTAMNDPADSRVRSDLECVLDCKIEPLWADKESIENNIKKIFCEEKAPESGAGAIEEELSDGIVSEPRVIEKEEAKNIPESSDVSVDPQKILEKYGGVSFSFNEDTAAAGLIKEMESAGAKAVYFFPDGKVSLRTDAGPIPVSGSFFAVRDILLDKCGISEEDMLSGISGRCSISCAGSAYDFKTIPLESGGRQTVYARLYTETDRCYTLEALGLFPSVLERLTDLLKTDGLLAICGPEGSGRTATLYSCARHCVSAGMITAAAENSISYFVDGLIQGQAAPGRNFSLLDCIRVVMRQEPDILFVGETNERGIINEIFKLSLTGHNIVAAFPEKSFESFMENNLQTEGSGPFVLAESLKGFFNQRLVRRLCRECSEKYTPPDSLLEELHLKPGTQFYRSKGCGACNNAGFSGRIALYECFKTDKTSAAMIAGGTSPAEIRGYFHHKMKYDSLRIDGLRKAAQGYTSLEEVLGATENKF